MELEDVEDIYPLTPMQEGMLFHCLELGESAIYLEQSRISLRGEVDRDALKAAVQDLICRHGALRTIVLWEDLERPLQVVKTGIAPHWTALDLRQSPSPSAAEQSFLLEDRAKGFNLSRPPLIRFALLQLADQQWRFIVSFHHLIADGWSFQILLSELAVLYDDHCCSRAPDLPVAPAYRNYVDWLESSPTRQAEAFWREQLSGFDSPSPFDTTTAEIDGDNDSPHAEQHLLMGREQVEAVSAAARRFRVTENTLVQMAWSLVQGSYSGCKDVLFGTTLSGRPHQLPGVENTVGLFLETIATRVQLTPARPLGEGLTDLQYVQQRAAQHAHCGLARIHQWADMTPGCELFETLLVFESMPDSVADSSRFGNLQREDIGFSGRSNYPLAILVLPGDSWKITAVHDTRRFGAALVQRVLRNLQQTLFAMAAADTTTLLSDLQILAQSELEQLTNWGTGEPNLPTVDNWLQVLAQTVERTPEANALKMGSERWSYARLQEESTLRARLLLAAGLQKGDRIGVAGVRTPDTLVSVLAVLKAGCVYVPLEPNQPLARRRRLVQNADLRCYLGPTSTEHPGLLHIDLAAAAEVDAEQLSLPEITADDDAYVIFTSGSTGTPRGVIVSHGNLLSSTAARGIYYDDRVTSFLLLSSLAFDSSIAGVFWTLGQGGTLLLPQPHRQDEVEHLLTQAAEADVSHLLCVPSLYQLLIECANGRLTSLRTAIVAGEACLPAVVSEHFRNLPGTRLYNEYGPTEATVWSTVEEVDQRSGGTSVSIGVPIPGVRLLVLDNQDRRVPVGVAGQLCIAGPTVAQGYLHNPADTLASFGTEPFQPHGRMYRSGDRVRWRENGHLEFIGREDDQLSLRGRRVEPAEIATTLSEHPGVLEAAVVLRETSASAPLSIDALEAALAEMDAGDAEAALMSVESSPQAGVYQQAGEGYQIRLQLDQMFIAPPRAHQRRWIISRFLQEAREDIESLAGQAKNYVAGNESLLVQSGDVVGQDLNADQIMEDWQKPVLQAMAASVASAHGHVLEIGFGRGISATMIQQCGVSAHTIIEINEHCISRFFKPWRARYPDREINMIHASWQEASVDLASFDGVFFHTAARSMEELVHATVDQVTYAAHFFATAARYLKSGGVFTYLANEVDSLSRAHQRLLLEHFSSFSVQRVDDLQIPEDTRDAWWAPSMLVVAAIK